MPELLLAGGGNQMSTYEELYRENLENRVLVLNDEIDEAVIDDFILYILKWNKEDMNLPVENRMPIKFDISSPGGNVFDANILVDVIMQSKTPVWGIGMDLVASAGFLVYLACGTRFSFFTTSYLQHEGEMSLENSRSKLKDTVKYFDDSEIMVKDYILSRTKMTSEFYDEVYTKELWMHSEYAKELGVVHKIIGVDCDLDEIL